MKNKYLLTVKCALASMILGILGFVGVFAINETTVSASSDVVLSVEVAAAPFELDVISPSNDSNVGGSFSLDIEGSNIDTVDVYVDFNDDGVYTADEKVGSFLVDENGNFGPNYFIGPIIMPNGTPNGTYDMKVVGHQKNGGDEETSTIISINYTKDAPQIDKITPDLGPIEGGTDIIIIGNNFENGSEVYIGDKKCLNTVVVSTTEIRCTTPSGIEGRAPVTIKGPNGTYTDDYGFLYYKTGGGGEIVLPNVPNTGIFRIGDTIVSTSDVLVVILSIMVVILAIVLLDKNRKSQKKSVKSNNKSAKKPTTKKTSAKRVRSKKYSTELARQSKSFRLK